MERLHFKIDIKADAVSVHHNMLERETYQQWTSIFDPSSHYEGDWNTGSTIRFIGTDKDGKKGGMIARIKENTPGLFVSIEHLGIIDGDQEITEGPLVEKWAGALENYSFDEKNGITTVTVDVDTNAEHIDYFKTTWPDALNKLKDICETR